MIKELEAGDIIHSQIETLTAAAKILKDVPLDYCFLTQPVQCGDWLLGCRQPVQCGDWLLGCRIKTFKQLEPFVLLLKARNPDNPQLFETALSLFQLNGYSPNGACEPELICQCLSPTLFWPKDNPKPLILKSDEDRLAHGIKLPRDLNPWYTGTMIPIIY